MLKLPKKLKSERLYIRPHLIDDLEPFFRFMSDREATQYLNFLPEQKTYEKAKELLTFVMDSYATNNPVLSLSIILNNSDIYIGSCGLSPIEGSIEVECYYTLLPEYWGNGYAIEALKMLFHYAFNELELQKIVAYIHPENTRSWKAAERAGMKYMGDLLYYATGKKAMFFSITTKDYSIQNF